MQELSLNILDIAENSVKAGASLITVAVCYRPAADRLTVTITDDGCGMDAETVRRVCDPPPAPPAGWAWACRCGKWRPK